jgi:hypothetical protein
MDVSTGLTAGISVDFDWSVNQEQTWKWPIISPKLVRMWNKYSVKWSCVQKKKTLSCFWESELHEILWQQKCEIFIIVCYFLAFLFSALHTAFGLVLIVGNREKKLRIRAKIWVCSKTSWRNFDRIGSVAFCRKFFRSQFCGWLP